MAAEQPTSTVQQPKTFTLTGKAYACYQAGAAMGANAAYSVAAENLRKVKHHHATQLAALRDKLLRDRAFPIPDDHPLRNTIEALPTLAVSIEDIAVQFATMAGQQQMEGSKIMSRVAALDTADEVRWRPPLRAWLLLAACMTVSTVLATLVVFALR